MVHPDPRDAVAAQGWRVGPGKRLCCSACGPELACEAPGQEFSQRQPGAIAERHPTGSEYRYCRRCCLPECRRTTRLIETAPPLAFGTAVVGEVA
jgi:hypothetical protein